MGWFARTALFGAGILVMVMGHVKVKNPNTLQTLFAVAYYFAVVLVSASMMLTACLGRLPW